MKVAGLLLLLVAFTARSFGQSTTDSAPAPTFASFGGTAQDLMQMCRKVKVVDSNPSAKDAYLDLVQCGQYLFGLIDGVSLTKAMHPSDNYFCLPKRMTQEELTRVVVKYADDHPENLHLLASTFSLKALSRAYPCSSSP